MLFVIEDEEKNKFGYYLNTQIQRNTYGQWMSTDNKTFLFSLKNNGRIKQGNGMMKFEIKNSSNGYWGQSNSDNCLFYFNSGTGIRI